jgi:hypothetical protein
MNADRRNRSLENFHGSSRNSTWNLLSCGAMPQPTASIIPDKTVKTLKISFSGYTKACTVSLLSLHA